MDSNNYGMFFSAHKNDSKINQRKVTKKNIKFTFPGYNDDDPMESFKKALIDLEKTKKEVKVKRTIILNDGTKLSDIWTVKDIKPESNILLNLETQDQYKNNVQNIQEAIYEIER